MFSVGNLVTVNTHFRPEFNSRIWTVTDFKGGRVVLRSADGLTDDVGAVKHIAVKEEIVTHLAIVPATTGLVPLAEPRTLTEEAELFARFVFGSTSGGSGGRSTEPLLNTWIRLPLLGPNFIKLTTNTHIDYELVRYPRLRGYQLHFFQNGHRSTSY